MKNKNTTTYMWDHQREAFEFGIDKPAVALEMDMGTGKTRVVLEMAKANPDIRRILVGAPWNIIDDKVWPKNAEKWLSDINYHVVDVSDCPKSWSCIKISDALTEARNVLDSSCGVEYDLIIVVINYEKMWRKPICDELRKWNFDQIVSDEGHKIKSPGSKISKYYALLGKNREVVQRVDTTGTLIAHSPLDVYGQFRFLDPTIFGTRYDDFEQEYAILGGPERRFVVGFKNQERLHEKYKSITYTCMMDDVRDQIKLPERLPPVEFYCDLTPDEKRICKELSKELIASIGDSTLAMKTVLHLQMRQQQITSGFTMVQDGPLEQPYLKEMNTHKEDLLVEVLSNISPNAPVVVFCVFHHDLDAVRRAAEKCKRNAFELSGRTGGRELQVWKSNNTGSVLAAQIQAGAEGVDMTKAHHAIYFTLPTLAQYQQSMARLYRPGQKSPCVFMHLLARDSIDTAVYRSLQVRKSLIDAVKDGDIDVGYLR